MPNTIPAAAEGMPAINRRRMLLGLAAASTAAAAVTIEAVAAPAENPKLITLAEELPAIAAAFHVARGGYRQMEKQWNASTPWAPDELTAPGIASPYGDVKQPGEAEGQALGVYLWRAGDDFPRRIVVQSWQVHRQIWETRTNLRKAKKNGSIADCLLAEEEIKRLKKLQATATAYETKFRRVKEQAHADHERLWPAMNNARDAFEKHVAAIMDTPDWTMEGLVIKAQALAEWDRGGGINRLAVRYGMDWHGQIAASILRHAKGGVA
jgi:hypothetical protein